MARPQKDPVRHHYVPRFLLSNFVTEANSLWVYDTEVKKSWLGCPEATGYEKHWHTVVRNDGTKDTSAIEAIVTARYDTPGSKAVRMLINREKLDDASRDSFFRFVAALMLRTPRSIRQMTEIGSAVLGESASRLAAHNHEFQEQVAERLKEAGASDEDIKTVLADIAGRRTSFIPRHELTLITNFMNVEKLALGLANLKWMFCFLPDLEDDFIIGDHPVLLEDVGSELERGPLGIMNPNIELIVPLSRRFAAVANHTCQPSYGVFQPGMALMINRRTLCWAERFVYAGKQSDELLKAAVHFRGQGPNLAIQRVTHGGGSGILFTQK